MIDKISIIPCLLLSLITFLRVSVGQLSPVAEFTTCGATGHFGPDQEQCNNVYGELKDRFSLMVVKGVQHITIPFPGIFRVQAFGASGPGDFGGKAAHVSAEFPLPQGALIKILVGQQGLGNSSTKTYGGSGASIVSRAGEKEPMLVAGGGAGAPDATSSASGSAKLQASGNHSSGGGGENGSGGDSGSSNKAGGGAGFRTAGQTSSTTIGFSVVQAQPFSLEPSPSDDIIPGRGGAVLAGAALSRSGGFGGGGYAVGENSFGGGGGYSGGKGASDGEEPAGGGSYISGMNQESTVDHIGPGKITFQFTGSGIETLCGHENFNVTFFKGLVFGETNFVLRDLSCMSTSNETHVIISSRLNECGTEFSLVNDMVNFRNDIVASANHDKNLAQRNIIRNISVTCRYPVREAVAFHILPEIAILEFQPEIESGDLLVTMSAFKSPDYSSIYTEEDFPLAISTNDNLYLEIATSLTNETAGVELLIESCFISPSKNDTIEPKHSMVEDGCATDPTLEYLISPDDVTRRFAFKAVGFARQNVSSVFIHCQVVLCNASEPSRCKEGCRRQKRSTALSVARVQEEIINEDFHQREVVGVIGPFIFQESENEKDSIVDPRKMMIVSSSLAAFFFVAMTSLGVYVMHSKGLMFSKATGATQTSFQRPEITTL